MNAPAGMPLRRVALVLSFGVGFLSLSQEIVWVRLLSFGQQGRPHAFSLVLVAFLIGIALGSMVGRRVCRRSTNVLRSAGWALVVAAAFDLVAILVCNSPVSVNSGSPRLLLAFLLLVGAGAAFKGVLFPVVHHLGSDEREGHVGRSVSTVYLANVLGSTAGPVVTGFVLLDRLPVEAVFGLIAFGTALLACLALWPWRAPAPAANRLAPLAVAALGLVFAVAPPAVMERIALEGHAGTALRSLVQNKHGVVHMLAEEAPGTGDVTFGGNVYDGRINVNMAVNSNGLERAYVMAAIHPKPRRVLVVGLSSGAWTAVILGLPGVEKVDVVEINPAYLEIIRAYPEVAPLLSDPRVAIHIDDGRRWLRAHPGERYDLVFQNTTFHWRAYSTLLLSQEYMREVQAHLNPGAILTFNSTRNLDVFHTAATVFPHVARFRNFAYMSDAPLAVRADAEAVLRASTVWGRPAFDDALFAPGTIGAEIVAGPMEPVADFLARSVKGRKPQVISDLNMVTEYLHGADPPFQWLRALLPRELGPLTDAAPGTRP